MNTALKSICIEETCPSLKIRYNEHLKSTNSKVYKHIQCDGHNVPKENMKLEKYIQKNKSITNLFIDKYKEDETETN